MQSAQHVGGPTRVRRSSRSTRLRGFDLKGHLKQTLQAPDKPAHLKVGLQNFVTTWMMKQAILNTPEMPEGLKPREGQYKQVQDELHSLVPKDKYTRVLFSMPLMGGFKDARFDFKSHLKDFGDWEAIDYPSYYLQPFHSLPGGWLNPTSAIGNRAAMRALYVRAHKHGAEGIREEIAKLVPRDAKVVYDFGGTCGDQSTFMLERLGPDAQAHVMDASPCGLALGAHLNRDARLNFRLGLVEDMDLPEASADVVNLMFVAHECPDHIKERLVETAYRVLKPGGIFIWTDPPSDDLTQHSRGFFEPYKDQWLRYDPDHALNEAGFDQIELHQIVHPKYMWTRVATKR